MTAPTICPICKSPISSETGLCPACLLNNALPETMASAPDPTFMPSTALPTMPGYELLHEINRGGQGVVYQAVQLSTKRKVALKVLLDGHFASRASRKRFEREIELVASLKHPNIIAVFDSGVTPDGRPFYVMDYVRGVPITDYIRQQALSLKSALQLFALVCDAVNHAHLKGVIHRDLKPSNILIDADGAPRILDFGLAKTLSDSAESLVSATGQVVGTLPYMSPEQTRGNPDAIDTRTDVYALGIILYQILTGTFPYPVAGAMADTIQHITHTDPAPLSRAWTSALGIKSPAHPDRCPLDHELQTITHKALAKQRERRYQSAGELSRDLAHYLAGQPLDAKRDSTLYVLSKTLHRYKLPVAAAGAFTILILASAIALAILYERQGSLLVQVQHESAAARAAETQAKSAMALEAQQRQEALLQLHLNRLAVARAAVEQQDFATARKLLTESPIPPALEDDWRWAAWAYLRASNEILSRDIVSWFPPADRDFLLAGNNYPMFVDPDNHRAILYTSRRPGLTPESTPDDTPKTLPLAAYAMDLDSGKISPLTVSQDQPIRLPGITIYAPPSLFFSRAGPLDLPGGLTFSILDRVNAPAATLTRIGLFGSRITLTQPLTQQPTCCALSHDGKIVAVGFRTGKIIGYSIHGTGDNTTLTQLFAIQGYREAIATLGFSADDLQIHAISDGMIYRVWLWSPSRDVTQIAAHTSTVRHIAFSPTSDRIATGSYDGHIKIWSVANHAMLRDITAHIPRTPNCGTICFFPDGRHFLSAGADSIVRIWDLQAPPAPPPAPGKTNTPVSEFYVGHTARGQLSPDGLTFYTTNGFDWLSSTSNSHATLEQWDLHDLQHPRKITDFPSTPGISMAYNLRYLATRDRLFTANTKLHRGGDIHLACQVYDTSSSPPKPLYILDDGDFDHRDLDLSPDGSLLALSTWEGTVSLWDWQNRKRLAVLDVNPGRAESCIVSSVRFHPTLPLVIAACMDSRATIYSTATYRKLATIDIDQERRLSFGDYGSLKEAAFSPDGNTLVLGAANDLWLIDLRFFDTQIQQLARERDQHAHP